MNSELLKSLLDISKKIITCYEEISSYTPEDDEYEQKLAELIYLIENEKQIYYKIHSNDIMNLLGILQQGKIYSLAQLRVENKLSFIKSQTYEKPKYNIFANLDSAYNYKITIEALKIAYNNILNLINYGNEKDAQIASEYLRQINREKYYKLCLNPFAEAIAIKYRFDILKMPTIPTSLFNIISKDYIERGNLHNVLQILSAINEMNKLLDENDLTEITYKALIQLSKISILLELLNKDSLLEIQTNLILFNIQNNSFMQIVKNMIEERLKEIELPENKLEELLQIAKEINEIEKVQNDKITNCLRCQELINRLMQRIIEILNSMSQNEIAEASKQIEKKDNIVYIVLLERQLQITNINIKLEKIQCLEERTDKIIKIIILIEELLENIDIDIEEKLDKELENLLNSLNKNEFEILKNYIETFLKEHKNVNKIYRLINKNKEDI